MAFSSRSVLCSAAVVIGSIVALSPSVAAVTEVVSSPATIRIGNRFIASARATRLRAYNAGSPRGLAEARADQLYPQSMPSEAMRFPEIQTRSLAQESFSLPNDFEGRRNIAVVAFRREHQQLVDTWLPFLLELEATTDGLRAYEIPVLSRRWSPARRLIDGGMAVGIADRETCERTLTSYTDVGAVQHALGLPDDSTIATVLTDRSGTIAWMTTGAFTEQAGWVLAAAVAP